MTSVLQAFDGNRQPTILDHPRQIKPGDWFPDLGTLRQVESVDTIGVNAQGPGVVHILHFKPQKGVRHLACGMTDGTKDITVWRNLSSGATRSPSARTRPGGGGRTPTPPGG